MFNTVLKARCSYNTDIGLYCHRVGLSGRRDATLGASEKVNRSKIELQNIIKNKNIFSIILVDFF